MFQFYLALSNIMLCLKNDKKYILFSILETYNMIIPIMKQCIVPLIHYNYHNMATLVLKYTAYAYLKSGLSLHTFVWQYSNCRYAIRTYDIYTKKDSLN